MEWWRFLKIALFTAATAVAAAYAFILVIDPYDIFPVSPDLPRPTMDVNQRLSYPALARNPDFDSAVFGTSTARLLRPGRLHELLGGRFLNLSLNNGAAYEQYRIADLFIRHHPKPRMIVFGIDKIWCEPGSDYRTAFDALPTWLYDDNLANDLLYVFNFRTLIVSARLFAYWTLRKYLGRPNSPYGFDGYYTFLPAIETYDLERARLKLYGPEGRQEKRASIPPVEFPAEELAALNFKTHSLLANLRARIPQETTLAFVFVPYHHFSQASPGSRSEAVWNECKRRIVEIGHSRPNGHVIDFMIPSPLTRRDENYWDPLHYTASTAERLASLIADGISQRRSTDPAFRYITPSVGP